MIRSEFEERLAQIFSIGEDDEEYKQMTKCLGDMGLKKSFTVKDGAYHFYWEQNDNNVGFAVKTPDCAPDEEIDKNYFEKFLAVLTNAHEQAKTVDFQASLSDLVPENVDDEDDDDDEDDLPELDFEDEDAEYDEDYIGDEEMEFDDDEECNEIKKIIAERSKDRFDEISDRLKSIFSVPAVKCNFFVYMTIHMDLAAMEYLLKMDCLHIK
uniref:hypothetical protein n=1 Tax=Gemmiger formicilis TaxID=745368 RepID=UPI003FF0380E